MAVSCGKHWLSRIGDGPSVITGCPSWSAAAGNQWNSRIHRCGRGSLDIRSRCPRSGSTGAERPAVPAGRHWLLGTWPARPSTAGLLAVVVACGKHGLSRIGDGASVITGCPSCYAAAGNQWNSRIDRCGRASLDLRSRRRRSGSSGAECSAAPAARHWLLATWPVRPRPAGLLVVVAACGKHWLSRIGHGAAVITGCPSCQLACRGREPLDFTT